MTLFLAQEVFICTASGRTRTLFPFASNGSRNALSLGSGAAVTYYVGCGGVTRRVRCRGRATRSPASYKVALIRPMIRDDFSLVMASVRQARTPRVAR